MSTENGYFLIADITGYTQYLNESELEHAQKILATLLNVLIQHTKPPLVISRLAGDAVISYGLRNRFLSGQSFVETLEDTYVSFRRQIDLMILNTTCSCNACRNIGSLDLKFFVHYGEFGVQNLDGHEELIGTEVNLTFRLLKNTVTETTGIRAYTLYTRAAVEQLGLVDDLGNLVRHEESYEHLGVVETYIRDMHQVWETKRAEAQVKIAPDDLLGSFSTEIAMPPELVWDYLIQPEHFNVLMGADRMEVADKVGGRVAVGSVYQCYHGDSLVPTTVLEWQPFKLFVAQFLVPIPIQGVTALTEFRLEPTERGTLLTQAFSRARGPVVGRIMADWGMRSMMRKQAQADLDRFRDHVEADLTKVRGGLPTPSAVTPEAILAAARESLASADA